MADRAYKEKKSNQRKEGVFFYNSAYGLLGFSANIFYK
jgi:hypothetical protein